MTYRGAPNFEPDYLTRVHGEYHPLSGHRTIERMKIIAGPDTTNGRGLVLGGDDPAKPMTDVLVRDVVLQGDGDDAACIWGYAERIRLLRVTVMGLYQTDPLDFRKVNKCFIAGSDPDKPPPNYPEWFKATDCSFRGGFRCPHIRGGVFKFNRCYFGPSRRNDLVDAVGDFVKSDFVVQIGMNVRPGRQPWSDTDMVFVRPLCCRGRCRLFFKDCTLTVLDAAGKVIRTGPASGPDLCRSYPPAGKSTVGWDADADPSNFVTRPNRK